ncbi:MAG: Segregation and condensation protein B [Candidatus Jorgensenbacteria bacterium GW2011_GWA1_48_13]|uniref:Segregation and condensation protein B n=1 Tax=Candidatus Jorgensenbacteria bacterium GW2011_GWB1_50_10 TaxID=1618665 RepID=A0A0G1W8N3_9BACT|nr:MAG: Segregation and condensation protein B [Candidatus Jorgensenbacteria bacterium GW2011_GWA1_48_13]KKW15078.1 MAG: Segregation and condensation protein B [Candidatus Jorgensenbacteria bacterium GW2011_GWB1_50_10]
MSEENSKNLAELEALLFTYGEPIEIKKIAKIMKLKENAASDLVNELTASLAGDARGLTLLKDGETIQLATKPELQKINETLIREEFREELSPAAQETLSVVAYLGPAPRSTIDYVRGVNSSFILRSLLVRGLVERETSEKRKNVYEYRVSLEFLKHLGLNAKEELPEFEKYRNILTSFETPQENP